MARLSSSSTAIGFLEKGKRLQETFPPKTPLQLACEMAECRTLYLSADDDEARDHWRGEYEANKRRYHALLERVRRKAGHDDL